MSLAKSKQKREYGSRTMGGGGSLRGVVSREYARQAVRRLGFVAAKMHEAMMASMLSHGGEDDAEWLNDTFKPMVDALIHFEQEFDDGDE